MPSHPDTYSGRYRQSQRQAGKAQVLFWLQTELRDKIDEIVRLNGYKSRSDAVEDLLRETISRKGSRA